MALSRNHSYFQLNTGASLKTMKEFSVFTELSIDIGGVEYRPDIAVYPKMVINRFKDELRMTTLPLLAIEIFSPTQGTKELLEKVEVYFQNGIKSCWLIEPLTATVTVFSSSQQAKTYTEGVIIDEIAGIKLAIKDIFEL